MTALAMLGVATLSVLVVTGSILVLAGIGFILGILK